MPEAAPFEPPEHTLADLVGRLSRPRRAGIFLGRVLEHPRIGRWVAELARSPMRFPGLTTRITRFHALLLRLSRGRLRRSWLFAAGQPVLALTTTGRRTGQRRTTAVACFRHGDLLATAGMNLGSSRPPAWSLNLRAHPEAMIEIGGHAIPVRARPARGEEREELWKRWLELQPSAAAFRELAGREIPIFILEKRD